MRSVPQISTRKPRLRPPRIFDTFYKTTLCNSIRSNSGPRTCQVEVAFHVSALMVIVTHHAGVRRPAACRCTQATLPGKANDLPFAPLRGHDLVRTISGVRMLCSAIPFRGIFWRLG
jgi:hypothetical protein